MEDTAQFFVLQVNDANIESEVKTDNTIELLFKHPDENCSHPVPDGYSINSTTDPGVDETAVATASAGVDSCSGSTLRYSGLNAGTLYSINVSSWSNTGGSLWGSSVWSGCTLPTLRESASSVTWVSDTSFDVSVGAEAYGNVTISLDPPHDGPFVYDANNAAVQTANNLTVGINYTVVINATGPSEACKDDVITVTIYAAYNTVVGLRLNGFVVVALALCLCQLM